jgi:hypothetical protein
MFHPVRPSGTWYFHGPNGEGRDTANYPISREYYPPFTSTGDDAHDTFLTEHGRDDEQRIEAQFRLIPQETDLSSFLTVFARAACRMPKLKEAMVWSSLLWSPDASDPDDEFVSELPYDHYLESLFDQELAWGIAYDKPHLHRLTGGWKPRKLTWQVSIWRPTEALHQLFQNIERQQYGDKLEED